MSERRYGPTRTFPTQSKPPAPRKHEAPEPHPDAVCFEVGVDTTKAAMTRLGHATLKGLTVHRVLLHGGIGSGASATLLVSVPYVIADDVRDILKPISWTYRSPTWIEGGCTIRAHFQSVGDEIAARGSDAR